MRFYLLPSTTADSHPSAGDTLCLERDESHHLLKVMRAQPGAELRLADGRGRFLDAELLGADGRRAEVRITRIETDAAECASPRLVLACAVVKGRRFEWALEKSVELGVHEILPLRSDRSIVKPGEGKTARWRGILRAAVKQAGRSWLPSLAEPAGVDAALQSVVTGDVVVYFGDTSSLAAEEGAGAVPSLAGELAALADGASRPERLVFVVGPEGGWSDAEYERLGAVARPVCLGTHRLRTETAAVAGMIFLQAARGVVGSD